MSTIHSNLTVGSYSEKSGTFREIEAICTLGEPGCADRYPNDLEIKELTGQYFDALRIADNIPVWVLASLSIAGIAAAILVSLHLQNKIQRLDLRIFQGQQFLLQLNQQLQQQQLLQQQLQLTFLQRQQIVQNIIHQQQQNPLLP